eukprot:m.310091 g.310091  ORF g.310091 m.310091 type:complete len:327 (+) comp49484_c0_seq1:38-1018(+)
MLRFVSDSPLFCCCRWFPVFFVTGLTVWSYYVYVAVLCVSLVDSVAQKVFYLLFFHLIDFLFITSYWTTILTKPKAPPEEFFLTKGEEEELSAGADPQTLYKRIISSRNLKVDMRTRDKEIRFCEKSRCIKPDRSHYCSVSNKCVLKMDHFCPWVNVTVGFSNYKTFLLFLFYTEVYTTYVAATVLPSFLTVWGHNADDTISDAERMNLIFVFFISALFAVAVWSLFGFHLYLLFTNKTTLESSRAPIMHYGKDKKPFQIGWRENFCQVMGPSPWKWFLPINNSIGNGASFPLRRRSSEGEHLLRTNDAIQRMEEGSDPQLTDDEK